MGTTEQQAVFTNRHKQSKQGKQQSSLTLLEQLPIQWTMWPILQILIILAAVTVGLQTNALAAIVFSVAAHWCSVTEALPHQHAKTAVALASFSVILLGLVPETASLNPTKYCVNPLSM